MDWLIWGIINLQRVFIVVSLNWQSRNHTCQAYIINYQASYRLDAYSA